MRITRLKLPSLRRHPAPPAPDVPTFRHRGFDIPVNLARMTGGGPETWDVIARGHVDQYERYAPISRDDTVFELGCGIGRDAIELTRVLGPSGRYIGVDIIQPSIEWACANIASRFRQFEFHHFDIYSEVHNNVGAHVAADFSLPAESRSVDRIIAQSVSRTSFATMSLTTWGSSSASFVWTAWRLPRFSCSTKRRVCCSTRSAGLPRCSPSSRSGTNTNPRVDQQPRAS